MLFGLVPPTLGEFIMFKSNISGRVTRASTGDCGIPCRHTTSTKASKMVLTLTHLKLISKNG